MWRLSSLAPIHWSLYTFRQGEFEKHVLSWAWEREKKMNLHEESNLRPSDPARQCSTSKPQRLYGKGDLVQSSYMTYILHTARISNVDSIMFVHRIREMVSFKPSKEVEKGVFHLVTGMGQRKILSSHEESNLSPSVDSLSWRSTTEPQRLYGKQCPLRSSWEFVSP